MATPPPRAACPSMRVAPEARPRLLLREMAPSSCPRRLPRERLAPGPTAITRRILLETMVQAIPKRPAMVQPAGTHLSEPSLPARTRMILPELCPTAGSARRRAAILRAGHCLHRTFRPQPVSPPARRLPAGVPLGEAVLRLSCLNRGLLSPMALPTVRPAAATSLLREALSFRNC